MMTNQRSKRSSNQSSMMTNQAIKQAWWPRCRPQSRRRMMSSCTSAG
jgi:hypothetical protein